MLLNQLQQEVVSRLKLPFSGACLCEMIAIKTLKKVPRKPIRYFTRKSQKTDIAPAKYCNHMVKLLTNR